MLPIDKGTRNLLPFLQDDPEEIFSAQAEVGSPLLSKEAPAAVPAAAGAPCG